MFQVPPAHAAGLEGPKWVSRWASLADSYAEPGSTPPQGECLEGAFENLLENSIHVFSAGYQSSNFPTSSNI